MAGRGGHSPCPGISPGKARQGIGRLSHAVPRMTVTDRNNPNHDGPPTPETDPVARRLRRRHWSVMALATLLLGGVLWAACHLTVLAPATTAADPWGPRLPTPSFADTSSRQFARLLHLETPHKKEPAETLVSAGPTRLDPAVRMLVDQGWPGLKSATIPAAARTAGIVAVSDKASP